MRNPMANLDLTNTVQTEYRSFAERHRYASEGAAPRMGKDMQIAGLEASRKNPEEGRIRIPRPTTRFLQNLRTLLRSSETAPGSS